MPNTRSMNNAAGMLAALSQPQNTQNQEKMFALSRAGLFAKYTNKHLNVNNIPLFLNNALIKELNTLENSGMKKRVEALHQLWFGLDTYHDLVDGNRAPNLKQFVSNSNFNMDDLSMFLFNDKFKLRKLINENLKPNENALKNQKRNHTARGFVETLKVGPSPSFLNPTIGYLKKQLLANLISQMKQISRTQSTPYVLRNIICDRNMLDALLNHNNITLLVDALKYGLQQNTAILEEVSPNRIATSPAQFSNSAITSDIYRHIFFMNDQNIPEKIKKINNSVTWYRQCVDIQLHHEFTNFCGVKNGKIHYIYIQVKQLKYAPTFISTIIIDIKSKQTQQYRYVQHTKTMYVYGSRGISLNGIDTFFNEQISQIDKKNKQKIAWLATDIKRSQDSTQVSYIQEYNKRNENKRTEKIYLITQDILCACRCFFSQVGCVLENKGRYFIFGNDVLETPRSPDMNTNRIVNGMLNNDNGTNNKTVYNNRPSSAAKANPQVMWAQPLGKSTSSERPQHARPPTGQTLSVGSKHQSPPPETPGSQSARKLNPPKPSFGGLAAAVKKAWSPTSSAPYNKSTQSSSGAHLKNAEKTGDYNLKKMYNALGIPIPTESGEQSGTPNKGKKRPGGSLYPKRPSSARK